MGLVADCMTFKCHLLRRLESGEVTAAESMETVKQARTMLAELRSHSDAIIGELAGESTLQQARLAARRLQAEQGPGAVRQNPALHLGIAAFERLLDKEFRGG